MSLAGRRAIVTGGASGIGRSIGLRLARDGADVAIVDLDRDRAERVAGEIVVLGRRALAVQADVALAARVEEAAARVRAELGAIDILVNDAGIASFTPLAQMTEAQWDEMIAVHLKGAFNWSRAVLPDMVRAGWGRIVNVSSVAGLRGAPGLTHYAAAKAGLIGFTKALATEVGSAGVTVNAIAPGLVKTPLLDGSMPQATIDALVRQLPVGRIGAPEDIAAACAFLVSDEAGFTTGQVISPNGGGHL